MELKIPELERLSNQLAALTEKVDKLLNEQTGDEWLTTAEAAELLRVNQDTIRRRARNGEIPCHRPGGKNLRFRRSEISPAA